MSSFKVVRAKLDVDSGFQGASSKRPKADKIPPVDSIAQHLSKKRQV